MALVFSGAAQAATLSSAAMPATTPANAASMTRVAAPVDGEGELFGAPVLRAILAAVAVIAGIIIAVDDDNDRNVSPG